MGAALDLLGRHAAAALAGGIVLGFLLEDLAALLRPALPLLLVAVLALSMVRIETGAPRLGPAGASRVGATLVACTIATPLAAAAVAHLLGLSSFATTALVLVACAPPVASAPNLAQILGLDARLALAVMLAATAATPLVAPPLVLALAGIGLEGDLLAFALRLFAMVAAGWALARLARRLYGPARLAAQARALNGLSALALLLFLVAVMDGVGAILRDEPMLLVRTAALAFAVNWGLQLLFAALARVWPARFGGFSADEAPMVALMGGNRNLALLFAALPADAAQDLALFLAVYQFPMYLTPLLYRLVLRRPPAA